MPPTSAYQIVQLRNGTHSVRSLADDETFHPGIGPVAEAEALYVRQLRLPERVRQTDEEFVLWDVGLGAAANAVTALTLIAADLEKPKSLRLVSFDQTTAALSFALEHASELDYPLEHQSALADLVKSGSATFTLGRLTVAWTIQLEDFPTFLPSNSEVKIQNSKHPPHAIMFDPHSPQKNPAMWTVSLFENLFHALDPHRPCSLATFTRSTMARAAMLLGGFFVGVGHASGMKEETTVAANRIELLAEPLDHRWLERAKRSDSAEPMCEPNYRRKELSEATFKLLRRHPQFQ